MSQANQVVRSAVLRHNLWLLFRALLVLLPVLGLILCFGVDLRRTDRDLQGTTLQRSLAEVTAVADRSYGRGNVELKGLIYLRLQGRTVVTAAPVYSLTPLHPGQQVQVTYRVGKSGKVYVDSIQPMASTRP